MPNKILDDLIAAGVPSDTILAVAEMIAQAKVYTELEATAADRRARNTERMRAVRARARTVRARSTHVQTPPPVDTTPPERDKPKEVYLSPRACVLPADWALDERGEAFARGKGWPSERVTSEAQRFKDHALAGGRRQKDWSAAWRNWVTSPYQKQESKNGNLGVGTEIRGSTAGDRARELAAIARQRELEAGIGRPPDPFGGS